MLACRDFEKTKAKLALALGKTIGGEPVIADLAKMPHLLVAGTTGSGKSVGINTMILSLLYRLTPEQCRLIMIDPKMLELSVYDGIPHLLTPVVTDPKKAVVALKWTVREMEDRYRKMSKIGVRNIDGFNAARRAGRRQGRAASRAPCRPASTARPARRSTRRENLDLEPMPYHRRHHRRDGRPDDGRRQGHRRRRAAPGPDGARRRHPRDHGHPAPLGRRHHRHHQGQLPDPHLLPGHLQDRQPHHPGRAGRRAAARPWATCSTWPAAAASSASTARSSPTTRSRRSSRILKRRARRNISTPSPRTTTRTATSDGRRRPAAAAAAISRFDDLYDQAVAVVLRDGKASTSYIQRRLRHRLQPRRLAHRAHGEGRASSARPTTPASARSWCRRKTGTSSTQGCRRAGHVCLCQITAATAET